MCLLASSFYYHLFVIRPGCFNQDWQEAEACNSTCCLVFVLIDKLLHELAQYQGVTCFNAQCMQNKSYQLDQASSSASSVPRRLDPVAAWSCASKTERSKRISSSPAGHQ